MIDTTHPDEEDKRLQQERAMHKRWEDLDAIALSRPLTVDEFLTYRMLSERLGKFPGDGKGRKDQLSRIRSLLIKKGKPMTPTAIGVELEPGKDKDARRAASEAAKRGARMGKFSCIRENSVIKSVALIEWNTPGYNVKAKQSTQAKDKK